MGVLSSTVTSSVANAAWGILLKGNHTGNPHWGVEHNINIAFKLCFFMKAGAERKKNMN